MYRVLSAEQTRAVELETVQRCGVTLDDLMARAGEALADFVEAAYPAARVVIACGPGNNGGDGWVCARLLSARGGQVTVVSVRHPSELTAEAGVAAAAALDAGVSWSCPDSRSLPAVLSGADVIVDALLGTGSALPLREPISQWCGAINDAACAGCAVVACDLPSGLDADSGRVDPAVVRASQTITFGHPKRGCVTHPGAATVGELVVADIGLVSDGATLERAGVEIWDDEDFAALVPRLEVSTHKSARGRVLVVAGSARFPGAAVLAVRGAMRMGAGYVRLATPQPMVAVAQTHLVTAPVEGLQAGPAGQVSPEAIPGLLELAKWADAVVVGPGLTTEPGISDVVRALCEQVDAPLVLDADALNVLVPDVSVLSGRIAATVLTPHPGELARLLGITPAEVQADRLGLAARLATDRVVVALKGAGTVVSTANRCVVLTSGTPALATAGTGDVLAGMVGALLGQGLEPLQATALGAHLHGRAGEWAAAELGELCVTAQDVPEYLPVALAELSGLE